MKYILYCGDCKDVMANLNKVTCIFANPPDNIGLKYGRHEDKMPNDEYLYLFEQWIRLFVEKADIVWISFNAKWTFAVGSMVDVLVRRRGIEAKPCVQTFTFGQHRQTDLGNNHRPLWRLRWKDALLYPNQIREPSWRQLNGDKRANPRGRVPGDVFDFPRVTGNNRQRRRWHPTQLHHALVERCIKLSTREGDTVCDPFAGTGTTLRVCRHINRPCVTMDVDPSYCRRIADENDLNAQGENLWVGE